MSEDTPIHRPPVPPVSASAESLEESALPALGRNPFEEVAVLDPFLEGLTALGQAPLARPTPRPPRAARPAGRRRTPKPPPKARGAGKRSADSPTPLPRWTRTPPLSEVSLPDVESVLDQVLGPEERRRLAALTHLVEGESAYDRFGFAPDVAKRAFPFFYALYRAWFRVESRGAEKLPAEGPVILAANHGGLLPFDGAMVVLDTLLHTDPPRLPRAIVDRWAGSLPFVNVFYARVGQVIGTRENFADLLDEGQMLLVFPEGMDGIKKPVTQRYRLQRFRVGFIEQALLRRVPIVPVAVIGSDDQSPILYDLKPIAKRLGLPFLPITPTFPWLGPLGLVPYPVPYRIVYGEPLRFHERFGPESAEDTRLIHYLAKHVRRSVQLLVDQNR